MMEAAVSAIVGDLINRALCFLVRKYYADNAGEEDKLRRLNQLFLRILAVVEEADGRYINNSAMLKQLEVLVESMYRGYHMLDTFKHKPFLPVDESIAKEEEVRRLPTTLSILPFCNNKRSRTTDNTASTSRTRRSTFACDNLQSLLEHLESTVANMSEFVVLLTGCERMYRRPYDTYLYTDNFMFGRHVEKQRIINFLLQPPPPPAAAAADQQGGAALMVLPVIGGCRVGKKVLISHACNDERVRSQFPSVLHISGNNILQRLEDTTTTAAFSNSVRTLVVIEFVSDIDDDTWIKFCSSVTTQQQSGGSRVIIVSRLANLARFGTVKPVYVNSLPQPEFSYLFKMLAFGNADQNEYPHLASVATELAALLAGSLIAANVIADLMRRNLNARFWLHIARRFKAVMENNLRSYGEHPKEILDKEHAIDVSRFASAACPVSLRLMPPRVHEGGEGELPGRMSGDLIAGTMSSMPSEGFEMVTWKSRMPPYTTYVQSVVAYDKKKPESTARKRRHQ